MNTIILNKHETSKASNILRSRGIGIFPTDTVYGIGCNPFDKDSIKTLYSVKNRNFSKPINILISNKNIIQKLVKNISPIEQKLIDNFWPGPLTIIFDKSDLIPDILTSNLNTVGLRMPRNKIALSLIEEVGSAIATSSANISGKPAKSYIDNDLIMDFDGKINFILDAGNIGSGISSTIVKVENNKINILREGSLKLDTIMEVINKC